MLHRFRPLVLASALAFAPGEARNLIVVDRNVVVGSRAATSAELEQARHRIDSLSRDDAWWVRMYAARAVRMHPELGSSELVSRLRTDEDPRVREAAMKQPACGHRSTRPE